MKSIGFSFNNFDLVIHTFRFAGMDWKIIMIQYTIGPSFQHIGEFEHGRVVDGPGKCIPLIRAFLCPLLLSGMQRNNLKYGMVTMCIGVGMGAAGIFELV